MPETTDKNTEDDFIAFNNSLPDSDKYIYCKIHDIWWSKYWYKKCWRCAILSLKVNKAPVAKLQCSDRLWGVVEWINDNPILNGMTAYESKERAIEEAREREEMVKQLPKVADVRYTIIEIKIAP